MRASAVAFGSASASSSNRLGVAALTVLCGGGGRGGPAEAAEAAALSVSSQVTESGSMLGS